MKKKLVYPLSISLALVTSLAILFPIVTNISSDKEIASNTGNVLTSKSASTASSLTFLDPVAIGEVVYLKWNYVAGSQYGHSLMGSETLTFYNNDNVSSPIKLATVNAWDEFVVLTTTATPTIQGVSAHDTKIISSPFSVGQHTIKATLSDETEQNLSFTNYLSGNYFSNAIDIVSHTTTSLTIGWDYTFNSIGNINDQKVKILDENSNEIIEVNLNNGVAAGIYSNSVTISNLVIDTVYEGWTFWAYPASIPIRIPKFTTSPSKISTISDIKVINTSEQPSISWEYDPGILPTGRYYGNRWINNTSLGPNNSTREDIYIHIFGQSVIQATAAQQYQYIPSMGPGTVTLSNNYLVLKNIDPDVQFPFEDIDKDQTSPIYYNNIVTVTPIDGYSAMATWDYTPGTDHIGNTVTDELVYYGFSDDVDTGPYYVMGGNQFTSTGTLASSQSMTISGLEPNTTYTVPWESGIPFFLVSSNNFTFEASFIFSAFTTLSGVVFSNLGSNVTITEIGKTDAKVSWTYTSGHNYYEQYINEYINIYSSKNQTTPLNTIQINAADNSFTLTNLSDGTVYDDLSLSLFSSDGILAKQQSIPSFSTVYTETEAILSSDEAITTLGETSITINWNIDSGVDSSGIEKPITGNLSIKAIPNEDNVGTYTGPTTIDNLETIHSIKLTKTDGLVLGDSYTFELTYNGKTIITSSVTVGVQSASVPVTPEVPSASSGGMSTGALIGIIIGSIAGVAVIGFGIWWYFKKIRV